MERKKPLPELEPEIVSSFANTFISRWDCYPKQLDTGKYVRVNHLLTIQQVLDHLYGLTTTTLGAYALDTSNQARWICFDADTDDLFANLSQAVRLLSDMGETGYLESSRRGGHLWLFCSPLTGYSARRFAKQLASEIGIQAEGLELYPKQDRLTEDGYGSLVRLPLGIHRKTGQRYHFIQPDGTPLAPTIRDQIRALAQPSLISGDFIADVLERAPHWKHLVPTPSFVRVEGRTDLPLSETLKGSISVFDFVSRYIELNAKGVGICPFHDDHEHSFSVAKQDNYWHCFAGCGGGSIIDFWMKWRGIQGQDASFTMSIKELRDMLLIPKTPKKHRKKSKHKR